MLTSTFLSPHSSWGESAGAYSVGFQLLINNGITHGLFHGAFMVRLFKLAKICKFNKIFILQESGSPYNLRDITAPSQQSLFDQLVVDTGCTGSNDPIACLRTVPFDALMTAVNKSPNAFSFTSVRLGWQPSVDGHFIVRNPKESLQKGLYAKVHLPSFPSIFCLLRPFPDRFRLFRAIAMTRERMWFKIIKSF